MGSILPGGGMVTSKTRTSSFSKITLWLFGAAVTASYPAGKPDASSPASPRTWRAQMAIKKATAAAVAIRTPNRRGLFFVLMTAKVALGRQVFQQGNRVQRLV